MTSMMPGTSKSLHSRNASIMDATLYSWRTTMDLHLYRAVIHFSRVRASGCFPSIDATSGLDSPSFDAICRQYFDTESATKQMASCILPKEWEQIRQISQLTCIFFCSQLGSNRKEEKCVSDQKIYICTSNNESKLRRNSHCTLIYLKVRQYVPLNEVTPSPFKRK